MERFRIEVGMDDNVQKGRIVGAVANESGIENEFIGHIEIYDHYSTIDLPEGMPNHILQTLQKTRVAGKKLAMSREESAAPVERKRRSTRTGGGGRSASRGRGRGGDGSSVPRRKGGAGSRTKRRS
jgi:ATP-dependent RNA helicase DeaD